MFELGYGRAVLAALCLVSVAGAATAGDFTTELTGGVYEGGSVNLAVGGIAVITPRYEGSKQFRAVGAPYVIPAGATDGNSRFSVRGADDLRFKLFDYNGIEIGPLAGWRFGRKESDADHLVGLGHISGGLIVGGYAGYRAGPLMPFVSYHHQVTGSDTGGVLRLGVEATQKLLPGLEVTAIVGTSYAERAYMESFFGVTAGQATTSHLAAFDAGAGFKDVYFDLTGTFRLDDKWTLKAGGRYARLLGDAADSPITETRDQFQALFGISYKFSVPLQ